MRFGALALIILAVLAGPVFADKGEDFFAQAVAKYQKADYTAAIALNERLLKEAGVESPAVYFNLGNCYFKQGRLGRAILNYLKAQSLAPRDADIKANLAFARQEVEQYEADKQGKESGRWRAYFRSLSISEFKWLAAAAWMLTGIICLVTLFAGWPMKRVVLCTGSAAVVSAYILIALIGAFLEASGQAVAVQGTEARFEPSEQATVYFKVFEGAELKVLRYKDEWLKVQRQDGRSGWIPAQKAGVL
ncbi:MAG: tetratricopeptide repeat protein [Candidatus Omnitrophica bacterium]|nr:tetratricopeptide repeat protein [Candidatus Omnitrophota bacterium]